MLKVNIDPEQQAILRSVQVNKMTSVASGTARGKDFISAVAALCFLYLTPVWDERGEMTENTKVAMTAPTDRQVGNIMFPEIARLFGRAKFLPGRLTGYDIRTDNVEWFLTGFKADEHNHEAWSGFHAANTMFVVTEASGISESVFNAIEGNLQGNSRILIVFNPNTPTGYAAASQKSPRWHKFRLDSLNAPNVLAKKQTVPGQVDYEWVADKVKAWCNPILERDFLVEEGDFQFDGQFYRPNDLFRVKVRGMFPKVGQDVLVPPEWIEKANERWKAQGGKPAVIPGAKSGQEPTEKPLRLGVDVAGMGRDSSVFCYRYGSFVHRFDAIQSGGTANHMEISGRTKSELERATHVMSGLQPQAFIDTIGEGAGVYSRLVELKVKGVHSVKFSEAAEWQGRTLKDQTEQYEFVNMRAYLYWAVRDWLNPANKTGAALPPDDELTQELTETKWKFRSDGKVQIEAKEDIIKRLKRSPDKSDALVNTFYPSPDFDPRVKAGSTKAISYFSF